MTENYRFVSTDVESVLTELLESYKKETGHTVRPADPEMLFIRWLANCIVQERIMQNFVGNQNIPSRAVGENLDALGETIYNLKRPVAQRAKCTMRFYIQTQGTATIIPAGTKVTDSGGALFWQTTADAVINMWSEYSDVMVQCLSAGDAGNGYAPGQINKLVDVDNIPRFLRCENIDTSYGGSEIATDSEYFALMKNSLDSYSVAGPSGAYEYWAKTASTDIADVKAVQPKELLKTTLPLYTRQDKRYAFLGGEQLLKDSLVVRQKGSTDIAAPNFEYTVNYQDGLLTIEVLDGIQSDEIDVEIERLKACCVNIYALMKDGTPATEAIKDEIYKACNADFVRPLTDYVACADPVAVPYNISLHYYISDDTVDSAKNIEVAVNEAVDNYIAWQSAKMGRDINPSELYKRIMQAGVKRVEIEAPAFTSLQSGKNNTVPQVALVGTINVVNRGVEDE